MTRLWIAAAALCCMAFAARAADLSQTGPQASAAQIIAARGASPGPVLRLVFAVSGGGRTAPATMSVDLAADYVFVRAAPSNILYDYRLRRVLGLDEAHHSFRNDSLYSFADFRVAETFNRRMLRRMLDQLKVQAPVLSNDPFWVQCELQVMDPADPVPAIARQDLADGGAIFSYATAEVASYSLSAERLDAGEKAAFAHLLVERTTLHPGIEAALLASGRLPQKLSFAVPPQRKEAAEVWTLQSASRLAAPYPLTAGYAAQPAAVAGTALAQLLPLMLDAVAKRAGSGPRAPADYRTAIDEALAKKAGLQASLLAFEAMEQYGQDVFACPAGNCPSLKATFAQAQSDPRVGDLVKSLQIEHSDPDQALKLRQSMRRDDVSNAYVIDGFTGNLLVQTGHADQALPLLVAELRGDPYVAGYYKDLGDLFRISFEPSLAWLCYDLGRELPGGGAAPVIGAVNDMEAERVARYPQFF